MKVRGSPIPPALSLTSCASPGGDGVKWPQRVPTQVAMGTPATCAASWGAPQLLSLLEQKGPAVPVPLGPSSAQFTGLGTEQLFSLGRREEDGDSGQLSASSLRGGWPGGGGAALGSEVSDCTQALRSHVVDPSRGEPSRESVLGGQHSTEGAVRGTRIRKQ